jgi:hypothetical protein
MMIDADTAAEYRDEEREIRFLADCRRRDIEQGIPRNFLADEQDEE